MESKERRASPRQPIKLTAQIVLEPEQPWPCQIADFCAEGLFIRYSGETARKVNRSLARSGSDELTVRFRSVDGKKRHELTVRVVRHIEGAMGVLFTQTNPDALDAMLQQCGASSRSLERSALKPPSEKVQFVLRQCAKTLVQHIEPLMESCFVNMTEALKQTAQGALNDQQANDYMDTAGQIGVRQRAVWHQMLQALESPLKPERKGVPGAELSLVDKGEFEDWLTIKVMVTKADTLYRGDLLQLKMRLDKLSVSNATGHQNPLGPSLICEAFHRGVQHLKATRNAEKVCLRSFETSVLQELGPLYNDLNQVLIRQGVLPDLDLSKYLSERAPRPEPAPATLPPVPPPERSVTPRTTDDLAQPGAASEALLEKASAKAGASAVSKGFRSHSQTAQSAFATVRNLVSTLAASRLSRGDVDPMPFSPQARPLSAGEFQRELQQLQVEAPQMASDSLPLKDRIIERVKASGNNALDEEQQSTLDVVDRFFRSVVTNSKLSEATRQQMHQLEVPVLKVVLRDGAFFDDQSSPVRGVMNRLAQLGVKGGRMNPVIQRRLDELVQRITTDFEQDTRVFENAVRELDTLIDRQNLVYRRNVERVTAAAEGAQKVSESKAAVNAALDHRLAGRIVPKALVSLLNAGWRDLLSLTWIRQGPDSQLWQDYLSVVDSLITLGDDSDASINLPELLRVIQDGLASISSNHMPSSQIRDELKQFLVRKPDTVVEMVEVAPAAKSLDEKELIARERESKSLQRWVARAQKLRTGDWLKDQENPQEPQYIRLVWIARGFSRFVFVNHQGMRVVELELNALARQMQKGMIVPDSLYDRPLVDESIDQMVRKVYDQLSRASTHDELTGLLARREFERMLEQQLARHEDERVLVRLDLRQLRLLNDTAGYSAGDDAIKAVGGILQDQIGDGMPLARLTGSEFSFLVPAEQAETLTAGVIEAIEAMVLTYDGKRHQLSGSAGLAPMLPALATAERWLWAADEACKLAKKKGNRHIVTYSLDAAAQARQEQITAKVANLSNLDEERMLLRCQKIIPLHSGAQLPTQYEVLISMYDETGNLITAADFVRMAERYNRMQAVDRWVVGHMLDWLRDSAPDAADLGGMCINLSGYSLNDESLLEFIYDKLSKKDAPIERLWFEITEAAAINDVQGVAEFIEEMRELGCRFCLGNFGSGPTSYQYMRSLPVDLIKLDGAFTRQVATSETDHAMVRSMVEMAHYMKREVIAAQVETREALEVLRVLGVDYAQGYFIEKPRLLSGLI